MSEMCMCVQLTALNFACKKNQFCYVLCYKVLLSLPSPIFAWGVGEGGLDLLRIPLPLYFYVLFKFRLLDPLCQISQLLAWSSEVNYFEVR